MIAKSFASRLKNDLKEIAEVVFVLYTKGKRNVKRYKSLLIYCHKHVGVIKDNPFNTSHHWMHSEFELIIYEGSCRK